LAWGVSTVFNKGKGKRGVLNKEMKKEFRKKKGGEGLERAGHSLPKAKRAHQSTKNAELQLTE